VEILQRLAVFEKEEDALVVCEFPLLVGAEYEKRFR
jgi:hypothetical protein